MSDDPIKILTEKVENIGKNQAISMALQEQTHAKVESMDTTLDDVCQRIAVGSERFRNTDRRIDELESTQKRCQAEKTKQVQTNNNRLWQILFALAPYAVTGIAVSLVLFK